MHGADDRRLSRLVLRVGALMPLRQVCFEHVSVTWSLEADVRFTGRPSFRQARDAMVAVDHDRFRVLRGLHHDHGSGVAGTVLMLPGEPGHRIRLMC